MQKFTTMTAVAALAVAFGYGGAAWADPFADAVESSSAVTDPDDATGTVDTDFAVLSDFGTMILRFKDNTCLADTGNDVRVHDTEDGDAEDYAVATGLEGEGLVSAGTHTEADPTDINVALSFTRISITDASPTGDAGDGAEITAVECLNNLAFGTDHINKAVTAGGTSITINSKNGADAVQSYSFEIVITNPDGADLSVLNFHDTVPGEFDILAVTADNAASPTNDGCDNVVFFEQHGGKLSPDKITWDVDLAAGESCTLDVDVETARKNSSSRKVNFAPTECPTDGVVLNEGVEVHDASDELILIDDSPILLSCVAPPDDPD